MLICGIFFMIGILGLLFDVQIITMIANTAGLIMILVYFAKQSNTAKDNKVIQKNTTTESTKKALKALIQKQGNTINFKTLKKENNPYLIELKTLNEAIEKQQSRIAKRTRKLHERNRETTQILQTISHEIKNPLSVIQASIETITVYPSLEKEMHDKLLHRVMVYSKKINALLNKLSLSESLTRNVISVKMEQFDILILCDEVLEGFKSHLLKTVYKEKQIVIEGKNRIAFGDRILIEQVLNNLIFNALKYAQHKVLVCIKSQYIDIIDDGCGVEKSELNNITKKFYQGTHAKQGEHSLGLGLFIVKEIAKIHNTKIEFFTRHNKDEGLRARFYI